jgi:alkylhydroperoxidase family enzyme
MSPATGPLPTDVQSTINAIMRGNPPLVLFTTLARDPRLFRKFAAGGLLDRGNLTIRQREIVIDRVTAKCGAEYEWGVHVSRFSEKAALTSAQVHSLTFGGPDDPCWDPSERLLIRLCDGLQATATVDDELWVELSAQHADEAILELLMLAGFYRTVSYLANGLRLPMEPGMRRFADVSDRSVQPADPATTPAPQGGTVLRG